MSSTSTSSLARCCCSVCVYGGVLESEGMCELCAEFIITSTWGYLFQLNVTKCQNSLKYYSYLNNEENLNTLYISTLPPPVFVKYVRKLAEKIIHQQNICKTCGVTNRSWSWSTEWSPLPPPPAQSAFLGDKNAVTVNNYS